MLSQKEDKEAVVQRMQHLHKELLSRPDFTWLNSRIIDNLDCLQRDVSTLMTQQNGVEKYMERVEQLSDNVNNMNKHASTSSEAFKVRSIKENKKHK